MKRSVILLGLLCFVFTLSAQMTGSFQRDITFTADDYNFTRTVYYNVPSDYTPEQPYKLVFGFRGGPHINAGQYRNQLAFLSDSINAIVVCAENIAHFGNEEELTKQLFRYTVDTTAAMYNIDRDQIYLTGLSFGGRHAVVVSMDTDAGDIPDLRGVIPFAAGRDSENRPNYENVEDFPPACFCVGLSDNSLFIDITRELHRDVQSSNGASLLNEVPEVGHTVAFPSFPDEFMECYRYIESTYETTSTENILDNSIVQIYPNPVRDILNIKYKEELKIERIYLIDGGGKVLKEISTDKTELNVSELPKGLAILIVDTHKGRLRKEFIIR